MVAAVVITIMSTVITIKLDQHISDQSATLSDELLTLTNKTLLGHHRIFLSAIKTITEELRRIAKDISRHPAIVDNIVSYRVTAVSGIIESFKQPGMDFIVIFNLEDHHVASYPSDTSENIDIQALEAHYRKSPVYTKTKQQLSEGVKNMHPEYAISKVTRRFVKAFALAGLDENQRHFLVFETSEIITDDFNDPIAIMIVGKILNAYFQPLMEFYQNTGSVCAVYLDTRPVTYAGFDAGTEHRRLSADTLEVTPDVINLIYASEKPVYQPMTFSGSTFMTICSVLTASNGDKIGFYSVGIPEAQVEKIKSSVNAISMDSKKDIQSWIILMSIAALCMFIFISFVVATRIVRPVMAVTHMVKYIAQGEGDLTKRLEVNSQDELGIMAGWFNRFLEKLQGIIKEIVENTITLNTASRDLFGLSAQMTEKTDAMTKKTKSTTSASQEMNSSMIGLSSGTDQMTSTIHEISRQASKANTIVNEAAMKAGSTSEIVNTLGIAALEIGDVTETITRISEQINLLALNATIEAARAGESGVGFSVVANEIKNLAKQTSEATNEIRKKIEAIQRSSETTIEEIKAISSVITEMNETFTVIASSIEEQSTATNEISKNIGKNVETADAITNDITDISNNIDEVSDISSQLEHHSAELANLAGQLKTMMDQFSV